MSWGSHLAPVLCRWVLLTQATLQEEVKVTSTGKDLEQQHMWWPSGFQDGATDGHSRARTSLDGVMIMARAWYLDGQPKVRILPSRSYATWTRRFSTTLTLAFSLPSRDNNVYPMGLSIWQNNGWKDTLQTMLGFFFLWWLVQSLVWSVKLALFSDPRLYPWFYPTIPQMYAIIPTWWG